MTKYRIEITEVHSFHRKQNDLIKKKKILIAQQVGRNLANLIFSFQPFKGCFSHFIVRIYIL